MAVLEIEKLKEQLGKAERQIEELKTAQRDSDELHNAEIRAKEKSHQKELRQLAETH